MKELIDLGLDSQLREQANQLCESGQRLIKGARLEFRFEMLWKRNG